MKKIILTLLCILLLTGCGSEPPAPTEATLPPTEPTEATAAPTEPESLYDPASTTEQLTGGAVTLYPLNLSESTDIVPFGNDLLVFAGSNLLRLDGDRVYVAASAALDICVNPSDPAVQVSEKGVTYYDSLTNDLVFLDGTLREVSRMALPEALTGSPALSRDRKNLYYFTDDGLRAMNLESGIDRLVTQMSFRDQRITALHLDDSVAQCSVVHEDGTSSALFLDLRTGSMIRETEGYLYVTTFDDRYYAEVMDGQYPEKLTGTVDSDTRMLYLPGLQTSAHPVLECGGILAMIPGAEGQIISIYDLADGSRPFGITLPESFHPWEVTGDPLRNCVWFLAYSEEHGCDTLYRWDYTASPTQDDAAYLGSRRTSENPDTHGLEQCAKLAEEIGAKYQIKILTWLDAVAAAPGDYTLEPEYQVDVLTDALNRLDAALSNYPEGFFRKTVSEMGDGVLRIGLVREIRGNAGQGTPVPAGGIQYWDDGMNAVIQLQIHDGMEQTLYHELFHVIESRIFSNSLALDDWDKLNPEGFAYSYNYLEYESRQQDVFFDGENQAFIDAYSTTFPREDRASVMAYAMMADKGTYFESPIMQAKLRAVCIGIREAYRLKKADTVFLWEQYLQEPLKFKK